MVDVAESTVRISVALGASDVRTPVFGKTLLLFASANEVVNDRNLAEVMRNPKSHQDLSSVLRDKYPDEVYAAATRYFSQDPFPKEIVIGSKVVKDQPTLIYGLTSLPSSGSGFAEAHSLMFNNQSFNMDWSTAPDSSAAIITSLQAGLRTITGYTGIEVGTWDTDKILITIPNAISITTGFEDNDLMTALGLAPSQAKILHAIDLEDDFSDTLNRVSALGIEFFYVYVLPKDLDTYEDHKDIADWVESSRKFTAFDFTDREIFTQGETTTTAAKLYESSLSRSAGFYSGTTIDYKGLAYLGGFSAINFNTPHSLRTGRFMTLNGCAVTRLTETQLRELTRKRINAYVPSPGSGGDVVEGTNFSGWTDIQIGIDWLRERIENDIYATLKEGRVPQTDAGQGVLMARLLETMSLAVRNGFLAPNHVSPAMTADIKNTIGDEDFNGFLTLGYLVYMEPVSQLSQLRREQRQISPFKIWAKTSGAVHQMDISIVFEQ